MAIEICVPRLGWTMEEGVFVEWLKQDGDQVEEGDALFSLENEKATQEVEAIDSGILRITPDSPSEGDTVLVGAVLGYFVESGEVVPTRVKRMPNTVNEASDNGDKASAVPSVPQPNATEPLNDAASTNEKQLTISPRAMKLADELGVDWTKLPGSGRRGRIRERDILAVAAAQEESGTSRARVVPNSSNSKSTSEVIPVSRIRRTIADRMMHSVKTTAPVTLTTTLDATNLVNLRGQFKNAESTETKFIPSYSDLIIKILSVVLRDHPIMNASWGGDHIATSEKVHVAVAVDTDEGLLVPVVHDISSLTLEQLVTTSSKLVNQARSGQLTSEEMQGGTFTVTNLGAYGVDAFTPIINSPQSAILGMGRISRQPGIHEGKIAPRDKMTLSLTFDHRIVDGAPAARFFDALSKCIENPTPYILASAIGELASSSQ